MQISNPLAELGYWFSQDGVLPETKHRFSESELAGEGWRLLAQLDDEGQMTFLDASSMYLLIPEQD